MKNLFSKAKKLFQPYHSKNRLFKGFARNIEFRTYVPFGDDVLILIKEDAFVSLYIESKVLQSICIRNAADAMPEVRKYLLSIAEFVYKNSYLDWGACLVDEKAKEMHIKIVANELDKSNLDAYCKEHYRTLIGFVQTTILEKAGIAKALIVYDKDTDQYLDSLFVIGARKTRGQIMYDKEVYICLANHHVVLCYHMEDE